jgi:hypothetical protein
LLLEGARHNEAGSRLLRRDECCAD